MNTAHLKQFIRGFFWRRPAPHHRELFWYWRGKDCSTLLLCALVICVTLGASFGAGLAWR